MDGHDASLVSAIRKPRVYFSFCCVIVSPKSTVSGGGNFVIKCDVEHLYVPDK